MPCANPSLSPTSKLNKNKLPQNPHTNPSRDEAQNQTPTITASSSMFALAIGSWLRSRRSRYLFLLLCSPILLPLLFACFPFLCAAEICIRLCRQRRSKSQEEDGLRRCEEGCCGCEFEEERKVGLLQRYLEDQLMLVGSVYECDDSTEDDCRVPLLS